MRRPGVRTPYSPESCGDLRPGKRRDPLQQLVIPNSAIMQNPFKKADAVLTRVKGAVVEANVTQTWNNEVQMKTATGDVLWRTMTLYGGPAANR